ncbi:aminopeptidase [Eggerthellaceae bacterium zg-1084]|uniref:aminopeptidase n=1 Tax=Berryella wangjianweii TaxID=2734634 RepID=UPI0015526156|nr:aminopeptidase [Berryella wangjianweii]NPD30857.1 aminopeptidase [Berryella wangjianweii]
MDTESAWKKYDEAALAELERVCAGYVDFISRNKTERECAASALALAKEAGYVSLEQAFQEKRTLRPGDRVFAHAHGKAVILVQLGTRPLQEGMNILGAHIDSPRLDLKQNPLFEADGQVRLDTHYYGGIKHYQWVALPLALHGVVAKKDGSVVNVVVGEDPADPVFCVTDLLIHLASAQMDKKAREVVAGEDLDLLVGGRPLVIEADERADAGASAWESAEGGAAGDAPSADKEPAKAFVLSLLKERYGIEEADFLSAELEVVPAGPARELGFDRSMVLGYGQDDRVCAYTSLLAQLAVEAPERTSVCVLVDKEEIGSVGATGMASRFFENAIATVMELAGESGELALRRALSASAMLSSDVSAGFDPAYASVFERKNAAFLGHGLVFNKYTGARGKSGSNDASAEYMAAIRHVMDEAGVAFQTAELGRVDAGGGGTIAYLPAQYGMNVIDSGVAVLSMHAPWEVTNKADIYEAYKGYVAFLRFAGFYGYFTS